MKNIYDFVKKDCFIKKIFELPLPPPPPELYPATIKPLDPQLVAMLGKLSRFTLRWQVLLMLGVIILHIILHMVHCQTSLTCLVWIRLMHTHYMNLATCNIGKQLENWKGPLIINRSARCVCSSNKMREHIFLRAESLCQGNNKTITKV